MTVHAHLRMKRYGLAVVQHLQQFGLVRRNRSIGLHLKHGDGKDARQLSVQRRMIVARDHREKLRSQTGTGIEFDVTGQHEMGHGRVTGDVAANIDGIQQSLGGAIEFLVGADREWRRVRAIAIDFGGLLVGGQSVGQMTAREVQMKGGVLLDEAAVWTAVANVANRIERRLEIGAGSKEGDTDRCLPSELEGEGV